MSNYGITQEGFKRKTYLELLEEVETRLKSQDAFGENIDFSEKDPLYQFTVPYVMALSELWEVAEHTFYSASPKFAEGNNLKNTGKFIGISAKQGSRAIGEKVLKITGEKGAYITKGFLVGTENGIVFRTTEDVTIGEDGTILANIQAVEVGEKGNVMEGTITEIINPTIGVKSVTNIKPTIKGQDEETDIEFRERYDKSTAQRATNIFDSILANVLQVTGVKDCLLINNATMQEVNGVPPKSFHTVVLGGENKEVARAIFEKFPGAIQAYGDIKEEIIDIMGNPQPICFSRPTEKDIWFKITLVKNEEYPSDGDDKLKEIIENTIKGYTMGQDVILYKLICGISQEQIPGIEDIDVQTSTDGISYSPNNVTIDTLEVARTDVSKIEVI